MPLNQILPLVIVAGAFAVVLIVITALGNYSLNGIKRRKVGDGQHGTARFATNSEIRKTYKRIDYRPESWRKGEARPTVQGLIFGCERGAESVTALVDDSDIHTLMIGASGVGKTANFLYPNIEYCCAAGMSFIATDSKGDVYRNTAIVAQKYYGYNVSVIDLRNPTQSDSCNMLYLVNKYMDLCLKNPGKLAYRAKAEKFAKITAKTIVSAGGDISEMGQNAFFYEAAEGLITSVILIIAEFCEPEARHIISVYKMIQELLVPIGKSNKTPYHKLLELLPPEHKARWFSGSAINSSEQALMSVMSTALARLNAFLDSEMEQILCFETNIDVELFCKEKSAIYLVLPEEDSTKHFLISLILQQIYREMLTVADERGGQLENRVMIYADEIGTLPKIDGLEMMFSASRSRKISIVAIIQSLAQFEQKYGKEGSEIIVDNCQGVIFGGFAPNSKTAIEMSKDLGTQTVLSGSVTTGNGIQSGSRSLQMLERSLMTADELKALPNGSFIVMKTGSRPMRTRMELFFKWGIIYKEKYVITEKSARSVCYADKKKLIEAVLLKHPKPAPKVENVRAIKTINEPFDEVDEDEESENDDGNNESEMIIRVN